MMLVGQFDSSFLFHRLQERCTLQSTLQPSTVPTVTDARRWQWQCHRIRFRPYVVERSSVVNLSGFHHDVLTKVRRAVT
jgi:hypothetical protein